MGVRAASAEEYAEIRALLRDAFGGDDEAELVEALREDEAYVPELELVIDEEGRLVAHVLFTRAMVGGTAADAPPESAVAALCLAPLAVAPDRQRAGVGTALVEAALDRAREMGERLVLVLGHPEYYPRFGFVPAGAHGVEPPRPVPEEAWMVLELVPGALEGVAGAAHLADVFDEDRYW
jgi:putative acetyltransferase